MTARATRPDEPAAPEEDARSEGPPPILDLPDELPEDRIEAVLNVLAGVLTRRLLRRLAAAEPANDNAP